MEWNGAVAQLGERYNGIVEVRGSIPLGSTIPEFGIRVLSDTLADEVSSAGVFRFQFWPALVGEVSPTGAFGVVERF